MINRTNIEKEVNRVAKAYEYRKLVESQAELAHSLIEALEHVGMNATTQLHLYALTIQLLAQRRATTRGETIAEYDSRYRRSADELARRWNAVADTMLRGSQEEIEVLLICCSGLLLGLTYDNELREAVQREIPNGRIRLEPPSSGE